MPHDALQRHPITTGRAAFTISASLLTLLIGSGTVYGYNALRPVLIQDGAFNELCQEGETDCSEQRLGLNFAETMCFFVVDIIALPCGILVDKIGLRGVSYWLSAMYALGFLAILMASQTKISYLYVIGLLLLAAAPCCTYLTGLASGKMLKGASNTFYVSSLVSLCYEVSPMFMYLLQIVIPEYLSFSTAFSIFGAITVALSVSTGMFHMTAAEAYEIDQVHGLVSEKESIVESDVEETESCCDPGEGYAQSSIYEHALNPRFLLHLMFMTVVNTKNQFYVATFADQIDYFASPEESANVNKIFDVGFFVSALVVTPIVIAFLGAFRGRFDIIFSVLWAMTMMHAIPNTFGKESHTCQMFAMMIFFLLKPLKWAASAEFLHHPPYRLSMYGRLYGIVNISCGAGALTIYPLTRFAFEYFEGSFFYSNLILTILEGTIFVFPLYLYLERQNHTKFTRHLIHESTALLRGASVSSKSKLEL
ncbi:hypothetical protein AAMO2058_000212100 [Amorphochlora amoebiformis]